MVGKNNTSRAISEGELMPTEYRRITFTNREVSDALLSFYHLKAMPVDKDTTVMGATILETENGTEVHLHHPKRDESCMLAKPTMLPMNTAAAILVNYCIEHKIPLPRKQKKALTVDGDNLVITIRSDAPKKNADPVMPL